MVQDWFRLQKGADTREAWCRFLRKRPNQARIIFLELGLSWASPFFFFFFLRPAYETTSANLFHSTRTFLPPHPLHSCLRFFKCKINSMRRVHVFELFFFFGGPSLSRDGSGCGLHASLNSGISMWGWFSSLNSICPRFREEKDTLNAFQATFIWALILSNPPSYG